MKERGGVAGGFLTVVLAIFIFIALLFGACAVCFNDGDDNGHSLGRVELVRHDRQGDDNGGEYGNGNDNRRCHGRGCRGSFSPGPFDRSPVDIHDNCVSLDCSGEGGKHPPADQQPESLGCAVPVPFHCDPEPEPHSRVSSPSNASAIRPSNSLLSSLILRSTRRVGIGMTRITPARIQ